MYTMSKAFRDAKNQGYKPILNMVITGRSSRYVFGKESPTWDELGDLRVNLWDGTVLVGDGTRWNTVPVSRWGAYVVSNGTLTRSLVAREDNLFVSMSETEIGHMSVRLNNHNKFFTHLLSLQRGTTFLTNDIEIKQGFSGLEFHEFKSTFRGRIIEQVLTPLELQLLAEAA